MIDLVEYISYVYHRFELVEPVGLDENQLKDIPYENIK
jgi:hypothetical protein